MPHLLLDDPWAGVARWPAATTSSRRSSSRAPIGRFDAVVDRRRRPRSRATSAARRVHAAADDPRRGDRRGGGRGASPPARPAAGRADVAAHGPRDRWLQQLRELVRGTAGGGRPGPFVEALAGVGRSRNDPALRPERSGGVARRGRALVADRRSPSSAPTRPSDSPKPCWTRGGDRDEARALLRSAVATASVDRRRAAASRKPGRSADGPALPLDGDRRAGDRRSREAAAATLTATGARRRPPRRRRPHEPRDRRPAVHQREDRQRPRVERDGQARVPCRATRRRRSPSARACSDLPAARLLRRAHVPELAVQQQVVDDLAAARQVERQRRRSPRSPSGPTRTTARSPHRSSGRPRSRRPPRTARPGRRPRSRTTAASARPSGSARTASSRTVTASPSVGISGTRISRTLDGRCVKTIVLMRPNRAAMRAAESDDTAASRFAREEDHAEPAGLHAELDVEPVGHRGSAG